MARFEKKKVAPPSNDGQSESEVIIAALSRYEAERKATQDLQAVAERALAALENKPKCFETIITTLGRHAKGITGRMNVLQKNLLRSDPSVREAARKTAKIEKLTAELAALKGTEVPPAAPTV